MPISAGDLVEVEVHANARAAQRWEEEDEDDDAAKGEMVARTYSGNLLPASPEPTLPRVVSTDVLPFGEYVVRKVANVREGVDISSAKVRGGEGGQALSLKAGSRITVLEVQGTRVRHALGWSSAVGQKSGEVIMEPVDDGGGGGRFDRRLKGTIDEVTRTHFVVQWDEATRERFKSEPELLREHAGAGAETWTESSGQVELPALWLVVKGSYQHECPSELNRCETGIARPLFIHK